MHDPLRQRHGILDHLDNGIQQAVIVSPAMEGGCQASLMAWERQSGGWRPVFAAAAVIGRGGFVSPALKREGDGGTPTGVYSLGPVFGYAAEAATAMPYRQITADDRWVDDPVAPQYNQWVRGEPQAVSWEDMLRPDGLYRYGIVVQYNTRPAVAGKGSAIFVHLWRASGESTDGCVALAEADLLRVIAWLAPAKRPVIILGGCDE